MTETEWRDKQLNKYLDEQDMNEPVSNCCGAPVCEESDICCECKEHCDVIDVGEYMYQEKLAHDEDVGDQKYEEQRLGRES